MKDQWEQEAASLRAEVAVLRHQVQTSAAQYANATTRTRRGVVQSCKLLLPVCLLLTAVGVLYGQGAMDALFIDQQGRVGIGTTEPHATLDVNGVLKAKEIFGAPQITELEKIVEIESNHDYMKEMKPESDGIVIGRLAVTNTDGDARCWIAGLAPSDKVEAVEARSWLDLKPKGSLETATSFTMPVRKGDSLAVLYGCILGEKSIKSIKATIYWIPLGG